MKKRAFTIKKLASLFAAAAVMISAFSCASAPPDESPSAQISAPESEDVTEQEVSRQEDKGYDIVFYRFYADEADIIAKAIEEKSGIVPKVIKYVPGSAIPERAVIIGEVPDGTGDALCDTDDAAYGVRVKDGKIYIYGGSHGAVNAAAAYFAAECIGEEGVIMEKCIYAYAPEHAFADAFINGISLSEFTVVYSATALEAKYSDIAAEIKGYLKENSGFSVKTAPASRTETEYEILLGSETGRSEGKGLYESKFRYNEYRVIISGTKAAIVGGNACAVWHGWLKMCEYISECGGNAADTTIDGTCELIKVACVGGSITEGSNSKDPDKTYPNFLQKLLGYDYLVKNFGIGGYSVVSTDDYAYTKHWKYSSSVKFAPDVVIWMLGINDGNPGQSYKAWEGTNRREKYIQSAETMFSAYENALPGVQIFVTLPSSLFESKVWTEWREWGARVEKYVIPLNKELAEKHGYPIIDMFSWANEHPEAFPDGLHPEDDAYKAYAERVYEEIKDVIKTPA